ncbi:MAG: ATP-binding cassette domain-containing protein [Bacilli bacterium]
MEIKFSHVNLILDKGTPLEKTILNDVSFEIKEEGIYSFIGASNSGKTAIGDLIQFLISPTDGFVKVNKYINNCGNQKNINNLRTDIGYVFKNPYDMFLCKTVREEIDFSLNNCKRKKGLISASDALKLVELDDSYLDLNPQILTLSDAKKVALACVLSMNPSILILDEYTCGIDNNDKKNLERLIRMLKNKYKKTIILLTKDTNYAYQVSDKVFIMCLTKLASSGDKTLLQNEELLKNCNLEVPKIVSFINECNRKGHDIYHYTNVLDLIKGVYRDVF